MRANNQNQRRYSYMPLFPKKILFSYFKFILMFRMKYVLYIIGMLLFFSCQNNPIEPNPPEIPCKLTRIIYQDPFNSPIWRKEYSISYNGDNITETKSDIDKFTFLYDASNNIVRKEMYIIGDPAVKMRINYTYDNQNRLIKKEKIVGGATFYNTTQEYFYTNGEMTEIKFYGATGAYSGKEIWTWLNKNPIARSGYGTSGNLEYSANNVYNTTKENKLISIHKNFFQIDFEDQFSNEPYGLVNFLSKNLLISVVYVSPPQDNENYSYTFNNKEFMKEVFYKEGSSTQGLIMKFTYSCD